MEFDVNWCRIASKKMTLASRKYVTFCVPGRPKPGRDTGPEIQDVPENTGQLATLVTVRGTLYK